MLKSQKKSWQKHTNKINYLNNLLINI
jgi:hypothetical protein